jgi:hypothetical protein
MAQTQETTTITMSGNDSPKKRSYFGMAVGVSASTNGLGVNLNTALSKRFALRLGYEKLDNSIIQNIYNINNPMTIDFGGQSLSMTPTIKTGGISAIIDFYLLKGFYLSGGVVYTDFDLSATLKSASSFKIGDIEFKPDDLGQVGLTIKPLEKLAPYGAIGFGRNISRDHRLAMSLELGAYYMTSYVFGLTGTNLFEPTAEGNQTSINNLNETLKTISWSGIYPVLKIGISYKFLGQNK